MRLLEIYRCFCDETRLRILNLLAHGPLCVCHFQTILGLSQVAVSKHLAYLRGRKLVQSRRHGHWMIYQLPPKPAREFDRQLRCLQDCAQTEPVFLRDLKQLGKIKCECLWVEKALDGKK